MRNEGDFSRRRFLELGGTLAAAGTLGSVVDPTDALAASRWPKGRLTTKDALRVRESQFLAAGQFKRWLADADDLGPKNQRGLRATGSDAERTHAERLFNDLQRAGVKQLHFENVPFTRWTTERWGLSVGGTPVETASYIPYSGRTGAEGVTGRLVYVPAGTTPAPGSLTGAIAIYDVPVTSVPLSFFLGLGYAGKTYDPQSQFDGGDAYRRPYLDQGVKQLEALQAAGAVGAVGVIDFPAAAAKGTYFPYDGHLRAIPGVYVDRVGGAALKQQAQAGPSATLTLPATVADVKARNLLGMIPGRSKELVLLHCHTDGSNAIEDNGPDVIVAMAQYLARLPRHALPRTVLILLNTGHFAGGIGARTFLKRHEKGLVKRTNAALTIEHVGLKEYNEVEPGRMGFTGNFEPGAIFAPDSSKALINASFMGLRDSKASPAGVLKPLNPKASGDADEAAWPGEGQYLYAQGGIPTANYITGPSYLLNWGITTADKVDFNRVRRQAIGFTEMVLRLGRTDRQKLR